MIDYVIWGAVIVSVGMLTISLVMWWAIRCGEVMQQDEISVWEKTWILFPRRDVGGGLCTGASQVWRRWRNGKWEYKEDPETPGEWLDRQW